MSKPKIKESEPSTKSFPITWESQSGEKITATIQPKKVLGEGNFGIVEEVELTFKNKTIRMAMKSIKPEIFQNYYPPYEEILAIMGAPGATEDGIVASERLIRRNRFIRREEKLYQKAKSIGLKVFPTCRIAKKDTGDIVLLITLGHDENTICIGDKGNESELSYFHRKKLETISNIDELTQAMLSQGQIAFDNNLRMGADAYLLLVPSNEEDESLDFVCGDVGSLELIFKGENKKEAFLYNVDHVELALTNFIKKNVVEDGQEKLTRYVQEACERYKTENYHDKPVTRLANKLKLLLNPN
jgi:hypothetical protein